MPDDPLAREFYDMYDEWIHEKNGKLGGPVRAAVAPSNLDLGDFNPRAHALEHGSEARMIIDGKSDVGVWCAELASRPDNADAWSRAMKCARPVTPTSRCSCSTIRRTSKRVTTVWLGRELKKAGFHQVNGGAVVLTAKGPQRLYAVRRAKQWLNAKQTKVAAHWNEHFASASAREGKEKKF
jgi:hypothetical protein